MAPGIPMPMLVDPPARGMNWNVNFWILAEYPSTNMNREHRLDPTLLKHPSFGCDTYTKDQHTLYTQVWQPRHLCRIIEEKVTSANHDQALPETKQIHTDTVVKHSVGQRN